MDREFRVAVTGHRDLTPVTADLVDSAIRDALKPYAPRIIGLSCLAPGADQIFADAVLDLGGELEAIIPARNYGPGLAEGHRAHFNRLLLRASLVRRLPYDRPTPATYKAANVTMLENVDLLLAVWDGQPARGEGGTAEVVSDARERSIEVRVLWPEGANRSGES